MISVIAIQTYKRYKTGMTDTKDLQHWLKEKTREDWPINLINKIVQDGRKEFE